MQLLGNVLVLILMAAFVAAIIKVVHHAIGSPAIKSDGSIDFQTNRILGFYGRWLVINQVELMNREVQRQNSEFKALQDGLKEKERVNSGEENRAADYSRNNKDLIPSPIEVTKINTKGQVSIWLPLGMCLICFGTWVSVAAFIAILPILGFSFGWLPFVAATSTMIAARL
jgi:hypothetical protein